MVRFCLPLMVFLLFGCVAEREFVVEYDYSYNGKFKRYHSFGFITKSDTVNYNGLSDSMIKREIERRMNAQGYKLRKKPSLYISYKVYGSDMNFKGYDQMDLENWNARYGKKAENEKNLQYIAEAKYESKDIALKKGTLLIDFIDAKTHRVIWQGYASGLFDDRNFFSKDVKYAVRGILNQYRLLAATYQ